jgi:hypothetical protein
MVLKKNSYKRLNKKVLTFKIKRKIWSNIHKKQKSNIYYNNKFQNRKYNYWDIVEKSGKKKI